VPKELRCFPGITPVVPGRAKDEAGKAIPSRIIPVILIFYFIRGRMPDVPGSSRIIPDVAGRVTDVLRLFPVVPRSFPDLTPDVNRGLAGALPGCK
jgi:hypothetical protein